MAIYVRTNLDLCGTGTLTSDCDHEFCWVQMRVCECGRGPLNESQDECGECR